jgi:hypothetical protein
MINSAAMAFLGAQIAVQTAVEAEFGELMSVCLKIANGY